MPLCKCSKRARSVRRPGISTGHRVLRFTPAAGAFQLVVIAYVHLPGGERRVVLAHAASALSPSGILFMVGHARRNLAHGVGGLQQAAVHA